MPASVLDESPIFSALPESLPLRRYGFQIVRHGGRAEEFQSLKAAFAGLLREKLAAFAGRPIPDFACEAWHETLAREKLDHHPFIKFATRRLPAAWLAHPYLQGLVAAAGRHVGRALRIYADTLEFRVVRPGQGDNNPWHRDHWFGYFAPLVNVYLPISGSHPDSALQVVPGSHLWTDEECRPTFQAGESKTNKNGVLYSVPEIETCVHEIRGHRMDVIPGDFALFSPRMVHGAGSNASLETRFSFEFRLEVAP